MSDLYAAQVNIEDDVDNLAMDVLADVLASTRIGNTLFCRKEFKAPWRMEIENANQTSFNIVSRGTCWFRMNDDPELVQIVQGDVILFPHGTGRVLVDHPDNIECELYPNISKIEDENQKSKNDSTSTVMFGGCYHFEHNGAHPLLSLLPAVIHIRADEAERASTLQTTLWLLTQEIVRELPGSKVITSRLVDVMFVYIIRSWLEQQPDGSAGWLGALRDTQIGKVLGLIHKGPQQHWTVESLAHEVSMSRAAFARRFTNLVGEPPMTYLTRWRMDIAARLLRDSGDILNSIAIRVGYETESSFSKAFRRFHGVSPGQYRIQFD